MWQTIPFKTPKITFGMHAVAQLGNEARLLSTKKALLVTGPSVRCSGALDQVEKGMSDFRILDHVHTRDQVPRRLQFADKRFPQQFRNTRGFTDRPVIVFFTRSDDLAHLLDLPSLSRSFFTIPGEASQGLQGLSTMGTAAARNFDYRLFRAK